LTHLAKLDASAVWFYLTQLYNELGMIEHECGQFPTYHVDDCTNPEYAKNVKSVLSKMGFRTGES